MFLLLSFFSFLPFPYLYLIHLSLQPSKIVQHLLQNVSMLILLTYPPGFPRHASNLARVTQRPHGIMHNQDRKIVNKFLFTIFSETVVAMLQAKNAL